MISQDKCIVEASEATGHSVKTLTALNIDDPASRYPLLQISPTYISGLVLLDTQDYNNFKHMYTVHVRLPYYFLSVLNTFF